MSALDIGLLAWVGLSGVVLAATDFRAFKRWAAEVVVFVLALPIGGFVILTRTLMKNRVKRNDLPPWRASQMFERMSRDLVGRDYDGVVRFNGEEWYGWVKYVRFGPWVAMRSTKRVMWDTAKPGDDE